MVEQRQTICTCCVMDTSIASIRFDSSGRCNFCLMHDEMDKKYPLSDAGRQALEALVRKMKDAGKGKKYDCICGSSGGRDSTWVLYVATRILKLRPLVIHFDSGWDSAIAVRNIYNACKILDLDLETYVVDWDEFKDILISFLKASTPDAEIANDVAIHAVLHHYAIQEDIGYILNGHSFRTEGIAPIDWTYMDGRYIKAVQSQFGTHKLKSFPNFTAWDYIRATFVKRIKVVPILNYFPYEHQQVQRTLARELKWTYYGGHHHESYYTKFVQSYLLPRKFNIDRRRTELSALIRSGHQTRDAALKILAIEDEPDLALVDYTIEKLDLTKEKWHAIFTTPRKSFRDYPTYYPFMRLLRWPLWLASRMGLIDRLIYLKYLG